MNTIRVFPGVTILAVLLLAIASTALAEHTTYYLETWEEGTGLWSASNGVWEVGSPSYGTSQCFGNNCAATNLDGQYPYNSNTRLESPTIDLPAVVGDGVLWLGIWHYFKYSTYHGTDNGTIHLWNATDGWVEVTSNFISNSAVWSPFYLDITEYAGQTIRIGFQLKDEHTDGNSTMGPGWYIDQVRIFDGNFPEPAQVNRFDRIEDMDWDGWYASQGIWQWGEPGSGISQAHSPRKCFGTVLNGHYPYDAHSRLISPYVNLSAAPLDGKLYFSFKQYVSLSYYHGTDQAILQINDGSGWVTLNTANWHNNLGGKWTERAYDISEYAGQRVRLGFYINDAHSDGNSTMSHGWYIDDLQFSEGARYCGNPERFENYAPNWQPTHGLWEVGVPESGPGAAYSGERCWGTNLDGNYQYGAYDQLMTPYITLDNTPGLTLRFQHWFSFSTYHGTDYGVVSIRTEGGAWENISGNFDSSSGGWTQFTHALDSYAGQTVQFGFLIVDVYTDGNSTMSSGWYIDDFEIVGLPQTEAPAEPFFLDVAITHEPAELVFPHNINNIEKVVIYGSPVPDFLPTFGTRLEVLPGTAMSFTDVDRPGWPAIYYRVSVVDIHGNESVPILATTISPVPDPEPTPSVPALSVSGAHPNPFNPTTYIHFRLPGEEFVDVEVFDLSGRKVADLVHKTMAAGAHRVKFAPRGLSSGTYVARVSAGGVAESRKMVLMK